MNKSGEIMSQAPLVQHTGSDEESIIETFHEIAQVLRLPELDWDFVHNSGETLVEGRPRAETDVAACPRWARFLGMSAVRADPQLHRNCWLGVNGPWTLEIIAQVR
jgi:hypothetical protein